MASLAFDTDRWIRDGISRHYDLATGRWVTGTYEEYDPDFVLLGVGFKLRDDAPDGMHNASIYHPLQDHAASEAYFSAETEDDVLYTYASLQVKTEGGLDDLVGQIDKIEVFADGGTYSMQVGPQGASPWAWDTSPEEFAAFFNEHQPGVLTVRGDPDSRGIIFEYPIDFQWGTYYFYEDGQGRYIQYVEGSETIWSDGLDLDGGQGSVVITRLRQQRMYRVETTVIQAARAFRRIPEIAALWDIRVVGDPSDRLAGLEVVRSVKAQQSHNII